MAALHPHELEFFIETNRLVPAERALQVGYSLMVFLRQSDNLGPDVEIRLSHLGQGSLVARIMAFLSHPATHGAAALTAVALSGVALLKTGEGHFPETVAEACIEANALRCGFRVGNDTFFVERDAMPAIARVEKRHQQGAPVSLPPAGYSYVKGGENYLTSGSEYIIAPDQQATRPQRAYGTGSYGTGHFSGNEDSPAASDGEGDERLEADYLETETGEPLLTEQGEPLEVESRAMRASQETDYTPSEFEVDGIFNLGHGVPVIQGIERSYVLRDFDPENLPLEDRFMKFRLEGPTTRYREEYRLRDWVDRHDGRDVVLLGRMVERDAGRLVVFETDDEVYTPHVPDDLLGWVPMGALVEVKGYIPNDDPFSIFILHWSEVDGPQGTPAPNIVEREPHNEVEHSDRLREVLGEPRENQFFAVGHIRRAPDATYFDVEGGRKYRLENEAAVRKILSGEIAAILGRHDVCDENGLQKVYLVKYQTAPWNILD